MRGVTSTELPYITDDTFEKLLASDDLLAQFFNDFLSLPIFPVSMFYNQETDMFEVGNGAMELVVKRVRSALEQSKLKHLTDPTALARVPLEDNCYSVYCLDREEGIHWILEERLPFFLQSDCYSEFRLAKMFQEEVKYFIQRMKCSSGRISLSPPNLRLSSQLDKYHKTLQALTRPHSQESLPAKQRSMRTDIAQLINTKSGDSFIAIFSELENPYTVSSLTGSSSQPKCEKMKELHGTRPPPLAADSESGGQNAETEQETRAAEVVKQKLNNEGNLTDGQGQTNTSNCLSETAREGLAGKTVKVQEGERGSGEQEKTNCFKNWNIDICCHDICCHDSRQSLDEFREFLRGTPGEKLFNLWMDIEKLKATQSRVQKSRYLVLMRSCYLLSTSQSSLHEELLHTLGLTTPPCWTEDKLHEVQPILIESLLCYWAPRFWTSQCDEDCNESPYVEMQCEKCLSPVASIHYHHGSMILPSLTLAGPPDSDWPQSPCADQSQFPSSRGQLLTSESIDKMFQALSVDSYGGSYFTHFCEQSGNQLWDNAINFWTDLQNYRELFYQDGLDPYRVQRDAQLLHSTYVISSARRSIGVDKEIRREVYNKILPAFEDLFDKVEEHTLNILLEAWKLLVERDNESFQKVCMREELRYVDSQEYRELQSLYGESEERLREVERFESTTPSPTLPKELQEPDAWSDVPPDYQGYRLGSLFRHVYEIEHFTTFLEDHDAKIHLSCWLDLEQYRRTSQKDKVGRLEKSSHIAAEYLNERYFLGQDSPATAEQQDDILRLAGGPEHLSLGYLSNQVVVEIQDIVKTCIEKNWLPLFLASEQFIERQKRLPKLLAADRLSQDRRRRARRGACKAGGMWMNSSKEILLFRRCLLNPVTCVQFQHFIALKGDFLENDLLFWLEVQRYKDLRFSHSDDASIQQKIFTIITCFINSAMPPPLQIDIPPEQAQEIMDKQNEMDPYIFREAQMAVFSELLKFWTDFQVLSSSIHKQELLPLLQEKRMKHRAMVQRQRRKKEEEEENARRRTRFIDADLERLDTSVGDDDDMRSDKKKMKNRMFTQSLSWSYSKYMTALRREELMLRRDCQLNATFSTISDFSFDCSGTTPCNKFNRPLPSRLSSKMESKRCNRRSTVAERKQHV